ncbi:DUF3857 domain-containing protein [Ulvibacter litoralis]|uniref:DUF3857 domain-containing protein n=1 Tax=Ulvibacter litoralis TaxID=227084 RepID=A0A1G7C6X0_9FLAO|nr:DUF3857 domain-containing protein [Ulvibacter litoralis]SDE34416.1 protein of unknown function [Ulvibacter litoralis]
MYKCSLLLFLGVFQCVFSQTDYSIAAIPLELVNKANSVLLSEYTEIDVSEEKKMMYTSYRAITVLNKNGNRHVDSYLHYDNYTTIKKAEVRVYDAFGKEIQHYKKKDFTDASAVGGVNLYSDDRVLYLNYTPAAYPYTLVFNSSLESSTTAFIKGWMPTEDYASSTKKSTYKLIFDPENKPRSLHTNFEGYTIDTSEGPNSFEYTATNIPAIQYEEGSLPFESIAPRARFSLDRFYLSGVEARAKDWAEYGAWMERNLLYDVKDVPEATVAKMKSLVKDETTNIGKARKIYQYLQDKVRYISVQIGIGGWKPMLASDVDKLSYGDCKALSNYMKVLLDAVGVPSYYTILYSGDDELDITEGFSGIEGNHVILGIPEGDDIIWLECTSQDAPFGFGGNFSDDRDVLIITPEGGKIVHTKAYSSEENLQETVGKIAVNPEGGIAASFQEVSKGLQYDDKYYFEKKTSEDLITAYKKRWSYITGLEIEKATLDNNRTDIVFTENLEVNAPKYTTLVGDDLLFCVNVFNQSQYIPSRILNRKQKLNIAMGYKDVDRFEIELPEGYVFEGLPEEKHLESKFGSYTISFKEISKNKIEYTRVLLITKGVFPPEDYAKYRSFRKKIAKYDKTKMLITPKTI